MDNKVNKKASVSASQSKLAKAKKEALARMKETPSLVIDHGETISQKKAKLNAEKMYPKMRNKVAPVSSPQGRLMETERPMRTKMDRSGDTEAFTVITPTRKKATKPVKPVKRVKPVQKPFPIVRVSLVIGAAVAAAAWFTLSDEAKENLLEKAKIKTPTVGSASQTTRPAFKYGNVSFNYTPK